jgi:hypothetical protein
MRFGIKICKFVDRFGCAFDVNVPWKTKKAG